MEKSFLTEAFKQLLILDEEDYQLNDDKDIKDMKDTLFNDLDDDSIDVIDPEVYSEDELSDSYVGKVILDCEVCHSKIYKNPDEIVIDEESQLANIEDECPYCMSNDGYKIIGEVAPFNEDSEDDDEDDEHEDDDEDDELEIDEEPFEDTKDNVSESLLKESGRWEYDPDILPGHDDYVEFMRIYRKLHRNPNAKLTPEEKRILNKYKNEEDEHAIGVSGSADEYIDKIKDKVKEHNKFLYNIQKKLADGKSYASLTQEEKRFLNRNSLSVSYGQIYDRDNRQVVNARDDNGDPILDPNYNYLGNYVRRIRSDKYDPSYAHRLSYAYDDRDINTGKRINDKEFYRYNHSHRTFLDKERAYNAAEMHDKSSVDLIGYKPLKYLISQENERHQEKIDKLTNSYNQKVQELLLDSENSGVDNSKKLSTLEKRYNSYIARENKLHEDNINKINADADEWLKREKEERKNNYLARKAERLKSKNNINSSDLIDNQLEFDKDGELSETFGSELIGKGIGAAAGAVLGGPTGAFIGNKVGSAIGDAIGDFKLKKDVKDLKPVSEELEKIEVNTDDEVVAVDQDENHININVSKKDDIITPVSQETKDEINNDNPEDNSEDDFVDYDIDDFDEESFNDLGESYLKKVYENVNSFKTTSVSSKGNTLTVEGLIKFNSGKEKATQFIFESNSASNNKLNFIGGNKQISRGKKSFNLKGQLKENKFFAESLVYNYRAKLDEGKSLRVYGRVKHSLTEKTSVDLSEIQGSIANLIKERHNELDDCKSVSELTRKLTTMLDDANIHTPAANRLLSRVASKKSVNDALIAIYNSFLSGANLSVIS